MAHFFPNQKPILLHTHLSPPKQPGIVKCKITYDATNVEVTYTPYIKKIVQHIGLIKVDFSYPYKSTNRTPFTTNQTHFKQFDELIFIKNGLLADTTIANIALLIDDQWLTPLQPLLPGTTRARLLETKELFETNLSYKALQDAKKIAFLNAMIGFDIQEDGILSSIKKETLKVLDVV
jgi:4-amino-4-deoxychorismate lyase